jgi:hypothetical protein
MDLLNLWLLLRWQFGQTPVERVVSHLATLALSTGYWLAVAALLTLIVSRLS